MNIQDSLIIKYHHNDTILKNILLVKVIFFARN